jgi:hypothetical protein
VERLLSEAKDRRDAVHSLRVKENGGVFDRKKATDATLQHLEVMKQGEFPRASML